MKKLHNTLKLAALALCLMGSALANNLVISNLSVAYSGGTADNITFDISWDNSWRVTAPPANYDAVWVIVKYRDCAVDYWQHINLGNTASHTIAAPLTGSQPTDNRGIFLHRSANGSGTIGPVTVTLKLAAMPAGDYDFKVHAVEMVYVPTAAFWVGDGGAAGTQRLRNVTTGVAYNMTTEASVITINNVANALYGGSPQTTGTTGTLPATYPKGVDAFYIMKYELSQAQYVDFLNSISSAAATNRYPMTGCAANGRLGYAGAWPTFSTTAPHRAATCISFTDLIAYLDWAALRPMTELEYEKASRGPVYPVANEYAWGSTTITEMNTAVNDGLVDENFNNAITAGGGPANYGNNAPQGPYRCGFPGNAATNRLTAGASYYGVMELSGNAADWCVLLGETAHRTAFLRTSNGDGNITQTGGGAGNHNVTDWANINSVSRGGSWATTAANVAWLETSRFDATYYSTGGTRYNFGGGRGVRTQ